VGAEGKGRHCVCAACETENVQLNTGFCWLILVNVPRIPPLFAGICHHMDFFPSLFDTLIGFTITVMTLLLLSQFSTESH
jgi:hypothetical protein